MILFRTLLLIFIITPFSLSAQEYNTSRQNDNPYDRQEVRRVLSNSRNEIINYCMNINIPYDTCFNIVSDKFQYIYSTYYQKHPYWEFLRYCENNHIKDKENFLFNEFFNCFDNYTELNRLNTPKQEINYLFILNNYESYFRTNFCRYNLRNSTGIRNDNDCRSQQTRAYSIFRSLWFSSATNQQFKFSIENCLHRYIIKDNNNIIIDFHSVVNCIQN